MSQNLPKRSLGGVLSLRHPNHIVLVGANNRNVIITYRFLPAPVQVNWDFFYTGIDRGMTVYLNCKYFPYYTCELLECLLEIWPSGWTPCGGNSGAIRNVFSNKATSEHSASLLKFIYIVWAALKRFFVTFFVLSISPTGWLLTNWN